MHTQKISETPLDFAEAIKEDIKSSKDDGVLKCVLQHVLQHVIPIIILVK